MAAAKTSATVIASMQAGFSRGDGEHSSKNF
jgi:hypothetical protein